MVSLHFFLAGICCLVYLRIDNALGSGCGGLKTRAMRSLRGSGRLCQWRKMVARKDGNIFGNEAAAACSDNVFISEGFSFKWS